MAIPIDFETAVYANIGKECAQGTLVQLKDGSLYLITHIYCGTRNHEVLPVSRSWAGMVLRESIREQMRQYALCRKNFKIAKYAFNKTGNDAMWNTMSMQERMAKDCLARVQHQRKCWKKFKMKSTKVKRVITDKQFKEGQKKKENAMKAKRAKVEGVFTHKVSMENFKHGPK